MTNREKVIDHLNDCMEASRRDNTWVFVRKDIVEDALALLKEQEEREQRICKGICDFIHGCCCTDTDADKDYVCDVIQTMLYSWRSVK